MKPTLCTQQRMDEAIVPLPEKREVCGLETLNGVTKADLRAALRYLLRRTDERM